MLSHFLPTARAAAPEWKNCKTYQPCTRRWKPFCQEANTLPFSASPRARAVGEHGAVPHTPILDSNDYCIRLTGGATWQKYALLRRAIPE